MGDPIPDLIREVQPASVSLQHIDDTQTLLVMPKTWKARCKRSLASMAKWGVTEIVPERDRFDEIFVELKGAGDRAGYLHDFQRVRETGSIVIRGRRNEDLRLVHQAAETLGVEDTITVPREGGPDF